MADDGAKPKRAKPKRAKAKGAGQAKGTTVKSKSATRGTGTARATGSATAPGATEATGAVAAPVPEIRGDVERRPATSAELKAMAHPVRLRILRLCLHGSLTNKELADRLNVNPATVLHHVRTLVENGFLVADGVRTGARGALEKPYRATGKSWQLSVGEAALDERQRDHLAMVEAFHDELADTAPDDVLTLSRVGLLLSEEAAAELSERLDQLVEEILDRRSAAGDHPFGLMIGLHRQP